MDFLGCAFQREGGTISFGWVNVLYSFLTGPLSRPRLQLFSGRCLKTCLRRHLLTVETVHPIRDFVQRVLDGKMAGRSTMHLSVRQIVQISLAAFPSEEDVVLSAKDDRLRLLFFEERLPFRDTTQRWSG